MRNNKIKVIISSIIILLPIIFGLIFWNKLPSHMPIHWGSNGSPNDYASKAVVVFLLPIIILALHFFAVFWTYKDPENKNQSKKALEIVFWICPAISVFAYAMTYSVSLEYSFDPFIVPSVLIGILFMFIGNYMPKCKQNRSLGIKIRSTLESEANWNATHRFAGKLWFFGGIIILATALLPSKINLIAALIVILILVILPITYSIIFRQKERSAGAAFAMKPYTKIQKIMSIIAIFVAVVASIVSLVLTFTGNIHVSVEEDYLKIDADYYSDLKVYYDDIADITLREDISYGQRTLGFGSPRLLMGNFKNAEFGNYTLYAYAKAKTAIVLTSNDGKVLVIALKTSAETENLYNSLCDGGIKNEDNPNE